MHETTTTIADFIAEYGITADVEYAESNPNATADDWSRDASHWLVTLRRDGAEPLPVPFSQGAAHTEPPTADDVLDCLASDASMYANEPDWLEWAESMGMLQDASPADLRAARETFETIGRQSDALRTFLGNDAYETLLWSTERL